jgi:hypothetical protein
LILEIKESKLNVHIIRNPNMGNSNMTTVIGQAWLKSSQKGNNQMRLFNHLSDGSGASFVCRQINSDDTNDSSQG